MCVNNSNYNDNIIKIRSNIRQITDDDINNLIMGIVSLIKRSTAQEIHNYYKNVIMEYKYKLRKISGELKNKNKLLLEVLEENDKSSNNKISDKLMNKIKAD